MESFFTTETQRTQRTKTGFPKNSFAFLCALCASVVIPVFDNLAARGMIVYHRGTEEKIVFAINSCVFLCVLRVSVVITFFDNLAERR